MLAVGVSVGAVSGFIIAYLRTTPLVVTLGMLSVAQGLALISAGGVPIYDVPPAFVQRIGFDTVFGIPTMVWIAAIVAFSPGRADSQANRVRPIRVR